MDTLLLSDRDSTRLTRLFRLYLSPHSLHHTRCLQHPLPPQLPHLHHRQLDLLLLSYRTQPRLQYMIRINMLDNRPVEGAE